MADSDKAPLPRLFWLFFAAGAVSWLGDGVIVVGFPLLAAGITSSPLGIAAVVVTQRLAPMLLSLPAGALADRWNARLTAVSTNVAQALLFTVAAVLVAGNHIGLVSLIVIAFLADACGTLFTCANGALLADVVEPKHYGAANTWIRAANTLIAFVIGPGVGGLLYATGRQLPMIIDACSFVAAAAVLSTLRLPNARPRPERADRHFLTEVKDGSGSPSDPGPMRLMAAVIGTMTLAQAGSVAAIVVLGTHTVGLSKTGFGWTLAAGNVAAVAVMLSIGRLAKLRTSSAVLVSLVFGIIGETTAGHRAQRPADLGRPGDGRRRGPDHRRRADHRAHAPGPPGDARPDDRRLSDGHVHRRHGRHPGRRGAGRVQRAAAVPGVRRGLRRGAGDQLPAGPRAGRAARAGDPRRWSSRRRAARPSRSWTEGRGLRVAGEGPG